MKTLEEITLLAGSHAPDDGVCLLEAVALFANEPHSDRPDCACPVISAYGRALNDRMPEGQRQRLKAYIPRLIGTRSTRDVEMKRMYLAADWACRRFAPRALELRGLKDEAAALRSLPEITDKGTAAAAAAAADAADAADAAANAAAAAADASDAANAAWDESIALLDALLEVA
jgi:hypothetical protein